MTAGILTAVISAVTSLLVAVGTQYFAFRTTRQLNQAQERDRITLTYLNPLRLYAEEVYARLDRIRDRLEQENGTCQALLSIDQPDAIQSIDEDWFAYQGYYLMSSCYMTACLFFQIQRVRTHAPFLKLSQNSDTELISLLFDVSVSLGKGGGIYYILQGTLAHEMATPEGQTPMSYRAFCTQLRDPQNLAWFKQLVQFYLKLGQGQNRDRIAPTLSAIQQLLRFLERTLGGNTSIEQRLITQNEAANQPR